MLEINCLKSNKLLLTKYDKQNSLYYQKKVVYFRFSSIKLYMRILAVVLFLKKKSYNKDWLS